MLNIYINLKTLHAELGQMYADTHIQYTINMKY